MEYPDILILRLNDLASKALNNKALAKNKALEDELKVERFA